MQLKNGMKVIAPKGCASYLTIGKEYEIIDVAENYENHFYINSDVGIKTFCRIKNCLHLDGGIWSIKKEQPKVSIIDKIDLLLDVAESVDNTFFVVKLIHLKNELLELEKNNPNDLILGAEIRKLLKE